MSIFDRWRVVTVTTRNDLFDNRRVSFISHMTRWGAERERAKRERVSSLEYKENETHKIVRFQ